MATSFFQTISQHYLVNIHLKQSQINILIISPIPYSSLSSSELVLVEAKLLNSFSNDLLRLDLNLCIIHARRKITTQTAYKWPFRVAIGQQSSFIVNISCRLKYFPTTTLYRGYELQINIVCPKITSIH